MSSKRIIKPLLALLLAFATFMSVVPLSVFVLPVNDAENETETLSPSFYSDGEHVGLDDDRILNVISVTPSRLRIARPNATDIGSLSGD